MTDWRTKTNRPALNANDIGKIPPQALDLEEAVLGAILLESKSMYLASKLIHPSHFYKETHQIISKVCFDLYNDSKPVDILTVTSALRSTKKLEMVGGAYQISKLTNKVASSANLEYHCRIVTQKYLQRESIRICSDSIRDNYEDDKDVFDLIDGIQTRFHGLVKNLSGSNDVEIEQVVNKLTEVVESNLAGNVPGIPTGVRKYDQYSGGQQRGHLVVYAGRPGMGKTARLVNEAYSQIQKGYKVVVHSLEMPRIEIAARFIGLHIGVPPEHILKKKIDIEKFKKGAAWLRSVPLKIFIDKEVRSIERETSIMVTSGRCDIAYIDYLQLIKSGYRTEIENISAASMGMKDMAHKLDIPVVALAQLNRAVESRGGDKKPILSDLRGSGQIEQDADVVEFLYRPEYYDIDTDEDGNDLKGKIFFINAKLRGGEPFKTIELEWDGPLNKIYEKEGHLEPDNPFAGMPKGNEDSPF